MGNNKRLLREEFNLPSQDRRAKLRDAENYRQGACTNCGSIKHDSRSCLDRPRKRGSKWTGKEENEKIFNFRLRKNLVFNDKKTEVLNPESSLKDTKICFKQPEMYEFKDRIVSYSSGEVYSVVSGCVDLCIARSYNLSLKPDAPLLIEHHQKISLLGHPNMFRIIDTLFSEEREMLFVIYTDAPVNFSSLSELLMQDFNEKLKLSFAKVVLYNALSVLSLYHRFKLAHGNLHPHTIVYDQQTRMIKLTDFLERKPGVPSYKAPEVLLGSSDIFSLPADIWALGCILGEMLRGRPLFQDDDEFGSVMRLFMGNSEDSWPTQPSSLPQSDLLEPDERLMTLVPILRENRTALDLIMKMLRLAPRERMSVEEVRKHAFFCTGKDDVHVETFPLPRSNI